jgi:ubiquitin-protein ligase
VWYTYHMKLEDLSYEQAEAVIDSLQALLAEANEDVPFNVEGEDQDPESYDKKEDAHLD